MIQKLRESGKNKKRFRQKLWKLRNEHGHTQDYVAQHTGTTKEYFSLIENGDRVGTLPYWLRLQAFYSLSNAELWEIAKEGVVFEGKTKLCK